MSICLQTATYMLMLASSQLKNKLYKDEKVTFFIIDNSCYVSIV